MSRRELTAKQENFCQLYVTGMTASEAYFEAYNSRHMGTVRAEASKLMAKPKIAKRIAELQAASADRVGQLGDNLIRETAAIAFSDLTQILQFSAEGLSITPSEQLPREVSAAISSIKATSRTRMGETVSKIEIRLHDKVKALDLLSRLLGLTSDWNQFLAMGQKFGLIIYQDDCGRWQIEDTNPTPCGIPIGSSEEQGNGCAKV